MLTGFEMLAQVANFAKYDFSKAWELLVWGTDLILTGKPAVVADLSLVGRGQRAREAPGTERRPRSPRSLGRGHLGQAKLVSPECTTDTEMVGRGSHWA